MTNDQKITEIGLLVEDSGHIWIKIFFGVQITLVNPRVFEKPKIAHYSLNNGRRAVLTPFLDINIFCTFWG